MELEEELTKLKKEKDNPAEPLTDDSEELDETPKKKKKEKKKKKSPLSKKFDKMLGFSDDFMDDEDAPTLLELAKDIKKNTKKKKHGLDFDADSFRDGEGKSRKKSKDIRKKYENMYKSEDALLSALLKESTTDVDRLREVVNTMLGSKVRGASKTTSEMVSSLVSASNSRLQIIKSKIDLKNKINDFVLKEEARQKTDEGAAGLDQEALGANLLSSLFSQGNKEFNAQLSQVSSMSPDEFNAMQQNVLSAPADTSDTYADSDELLAGVPEEIRQDIANPATIKQDDFVPPIDPVLEENFQNLNEQFRDNEIYGRSEAGDALIAHESEGVSIKIRRWFDENGDMQWQFAAINRDGDEVEGYEVPDEKICGPVKFTDESNVATDKFGRTYEIIELA